jgi:uncharacterized protein (DUF1800 family)
MMASAMRRLAPLFVVASFAAVPTGALAKPGDYDDDGIPDALEAAEGRSWLVKDNDIFASGRLFIKQVCRDVLRREADDWLVQAWAPAVDAGSVTRENAIASFMKSEEFNVRVGTVMRLHFAMLRRYPDFAGLSSWIAARDAGMDNVAIAERFTAMPEYLALYGNTSNTQFLQLAYRYVLERQPDPYGFGLWLAELDSGRYSRGRLLYAFADSGEGQARLLARVQTAALFYAMVGADPDAAGYAYWQSIMEKGYPLEQIVPWFYHTVWYKSRFMPYYVLARTPEAVDAARFLAQATFGPTSLTDITSLMTRGLDPWINEQLTLPASSHVQYLTAAQARDTNGKVYEDSTYEAIWQQWLYDKAQLRARVAFALSEIFVISNIAPNLNPWAMSSYMDMLNRNAFGNYRTLLEEVTLHPAMGYYLNMLGNEKEDPSKNRMPNENYAREVMQLFSIGLAQLSTDGSPVLGADGKPIPTYGEETVAGFAKVFTGWGFGGNDNADNATWYKQKANWTVPMVAWPLRHSTAAKPLLNGTVLPAGQSPERDLKDALDNIFWHPNVGPFTCRQLIQRLVTSNPSRAQVRRCAETFNNNGYGERGNLAFVVRNILMDPEARDASLATLAGAGKQREPVVRFANFLRAFNARSPTGRNAIHYLDSASDSLGQSPLLAPSVFNFFSPSFRPPGPVAAAGLVAPEFQITTETSVVGALNFFGGLADRGYYGWKTDTRLTLDYTVLQTVAAASPAMLADHIDMLLFAGGMSPGTRATIVNAVGAISASKPRDRVEAALIIASMSPDYVIQK